MVSRVALWLMASGCGILLSCSGKDASEEADAECQPACAAAIHLTIDAGVPADADAITTWTSDSESIAEGDFVSFAVTAPDGGNVVTTAQTLGSEEIDACACPQVDLER